MKRLSLVSLSLLLLIAVFAVSVWAAAPPTMNSRIIDGQRATYAIAGAANTPAATPTDVVTLYGSATKTIAVRKVIVSGMATTAGSMDVVLTKRTAANTAGTSTAPSIAKFSSNDGTATATPALYTANPSALGTGIALAEKKLNFGVAGAAGVVEFDFTNATGKPVYLIGATQGLAINLNGGTVPTGGTFGYTVIWEEF
ncbi:MAG: hypothetical protein A4E65_00337 [Syntrophorhabdus sp. PtaU1.Bin153]|nr:MAG: hypothetical protein A4E65_00337 [Syntrophorhabdus sp. PtaU1.Bin153]